MSSCIFVLISYAVVKIGTMMMMMMMSEMVGEGLSSCVAMVQLSAKMPNRKN